MVIGVSSDVIAVSATPIGASLVLITAIAKALALRPPLPSSAVNVIVGNLAVISSWVGVPCSVPLSSNVSHKGILSDDVIVILSPSASVTLNS